jgi:LysM repeat protein/ABC-type branched-subunit amino acid transport system substrate-binding protein
MGITKRYTSFPLFRYAICLMLLLHACGPAKKTTVAPSSESYQPHTVVKGETLSKIANTYNVTVSQILVMNPGLNANNIKPGQIIKIPIKKPEPKKESEEAKEPVPEKKKDFMRIALLLPFNAAYHAETNTSDDAINIDPATTSWIHFYEGVMTALDSLGSDGNNFEVSLYDTWSDSLKLSRLIRDSLFVKNDLVIGGGVTGFLPAITAAASQNQKPLIIIQNNSSSFLEGKPEVLLTTPSISLQCKLMCDYLYDKYARENIVILHQDSRKENDIAAMFNSALQARQFSKGSNDSLPVKNFVYNGKLFEKESTLLDKSKKNIFIIPSSDEAFVSPVISRLDSLDEYQFVVCGIPTWENFESIEPQKLQKLHTLIFSTSFVDYNDAAVKSFRRSFVEKYKADPLYNAYLGFSIAYLSGTVLEKGEDKDFIKLLDKKDSKESRTLPAKFDFRSNSKNDGKENYHISILRFDNYRLVSVE